MTKPTPQETLKTAFRQRVKSWYLRKPETSRPDARLHLSNFPTLEPVLIKHYDALIDCFDRVIVNANARRGRPVDTYERHLYDDLLKQDLPPVLQALWDDLKTHTDTVNKQLDELGLSERFSPASLFGPLVWEAMKTYHVGVGLAMNFVEPDVGNMVRT